MFWKKAPAKEPPDKLKSMKALDMSARALEQAEKLLEHEFYEQVILYSYTSVRMMQAQQLIPLKPF